MIIIWHIPGERSFLPLYCLHFRFTVILAVIHIAIGSAKVLGFRLMDNFKALILRSVYMISGDDGIFP